MNRYRWFAVLTALFLFLSGCGQAASSQMEDVGEYILIDPGHGGEDGGAQAEDGTLEKNINLAISLHIHDLMQVCGFPVLLTRDTDTSIHDPSADTIRSKKVSDMRNRLLLYQQAQLVISVHQNHFSAAQYSGTQVFYSPNHPDGQRLATCVREAVVEQIQPDNTREIKKATDGIYLLHHTETPAVLVECGFLSNPTERERLKTPAYQQQMGFAVVSGYWKYLIEE